MPITDSHNSNFSPIDPNATQIPPSLCLIRPPISMEASGSERKRKRSHREQAHRRQLNSGEMVAGKSGGAGEEMEAEEGTSKPCPTPTLPPLDEEVEEFFGILRRMHAAVKYFGKSGHGNGTRRCTASETGLPLTAPALNVNGEAGQVKRVEQKAENCVSFDLNVVPAEAAEANGD